VSTKTEAEKIEKMFSLIENMEYGMLVTKLNDGSLRSRPMSTKTTDTDDCLWFLTDADSAKILEIEENRQVNISFSQPSNHTFVSVTGTASVTNDKSKLDEIWGTDAELWFPEGKSSPNLTLIKVAPTTAEYWSSDDGLFVSIYKMATAAMSGNRPDDLGSNETVKLDAGE